MDYHELLLTFSKMEWTYFYGYYKSFLNWGIIIQKNQEPGSDFLNVEKFVEKNIVRYELIFNKDNIILIDEHKLNITDYIKYLNYVLKIMVSNKIPIGKY